MIRILGVCIAIIIGLVITINGIFMLASPRAWFHLPHWLRPVGGSVTEDKCTTGWGAIQTRLTGAGFLVTIAWVLYDMFFKHG